MCEQRLSFKKNSNISFTAVSFGGSLEYGFSKEKNELTDNTQNRSLCYKNFVI